VPNPLRENIDAPESSAAPCPPTGYPTNATRIIAYSVLGERHGLEETIRLRMVHVRGTTRAIRHFIDPDRFVLCAASRWAYVEALSWVRVPFVLKLPVSLPPCTIRDPGPDRRLTLEL